MQKFIGIGLICLVLFYAVHLKFDCAKILNSERMVYNVFISCKVILVVYFLSSNALLSHLMADENYDTVLTLG